MPASAIWQFRHTHFSLKQHMRTIIVRPHEPPIWTTNTWALTTGAGELQGEPVGQLIAVCSWTEVVRFCRLTAGYLSGERAPSDLTLAVDKCSNEDVTEPTYN